MNSQGNTSFEFLSWPFPSPWTLILPHSPTWPISVPWTTRTWIPLRSPLPDGPLHGGRCLGQFPSWVPKAALHMLEVSWDKQCVFPVSGHSQSHYWFWNLFPGVSDSASNKPVNARVLDMFNRWYQDALKWCKDNLPKFSEAYCALEVGHPQEQELFIYPAGVCHQTNITKCLPARNKYLAGKQRCTDSPTTGLGV